LIKEFTIVGAPHVKYNIAGCDSIIYWLKDDKSKVLEIIRSKYDLFRDDDEGPKWILGNLIFHSAIIDVNNLDHIFNVESSRGNDFKQDLPIEVKTIIILIISKKEIRA